MCRFLQSEEPVLINTYLFDDFGTDTELKFLQLLGKLLARLKPQSTVFQGLTPPGYGQSRFQRWKRDRQ